MQKYLPSGILLLLPPMALFGHQQITVLMLIMGIVIFSEDKSYGRYLLRNTRLFSIPLLLFLLLTFFSCKNMSEFMKISVLGLVALQAIAIPEKYLSHHSRLAFMIGYALLLLTIAVDASLGQPLNKIFDRSPAKMYIQASLFISVLMWPLMGIIQGAKKRIIQISVLMASLAATFFLHSDTASLAILIALVLASILHVLSHMGQLFTAWMFGILSGVFTFTSPFLFKFILNHEKFLDFSSVFKDISYLHRIEIWKNVAEKILEAPFFGHCLGSYRLLPQDVIQICNGKCFYPAEKFGLHAHNLPLHLAYETGMAGLAVISFIIGAVAYRITKDASPEARFLKTGCFLSIMISFWLSVGAYQSWWLSTVIFAIFLFQRSDHEPHRHAQNQG